VDIVLNQTQLAALMDYAAAQTFGFGFDPDCHYYNDGVSLTIETCTVPEPTTMGAMMSAVAVVGIKRRIQSSRL
jgi:hypothetical protein